MPGEEERIMSAIQALPIDEREIMLRELQRALGSSGARRMSTTSPEHNQLLEMMMRAGG
jgi:hypothetical protein